MLSLEKVLFYLVPMGKGLNKDNGSDNDNNKLTLQSIEEKKSKLYKL